MRRFFAYLTAFIREDFNLRLYAGTAAFVAAMTAFNYAVDLEDGIIDKHRGEVLRFWLYAGLDAFMYYSVTVFWLLANRQLSILKTARFWLFSLAAIGVLAWWQDYTGYSKVVGLPVFGEIYSFAHYCFSNLSSALTVWVPFAVFYVLVDRQPSHFYGFRPDWLSLKMYGILLLLMVPLIAWASFQPSFLQTYPIYKGWGAALALHWPEWIPAVIFELCYGFDFISTELIFRGFLIIGMMQVVGRGAVLPMVAVYATVHFGKPLGETIGSVFGGYILGVLAYQSRTIWGGIAIHLGVAWLMELGAFLQSFVHSPEK